MKLVRRSIERPTLTGTLLIPIPMRCDHKICLHSLEKRSYRVESVEEIKRGKERCKRKEGPAKGDKRRKTKIGPKMRIEKSKGRMNAKKKTEKKTKKKKGGDGEQFHEESGWLTDDLIKRGTNYRPAGC